MLLQYLHVAAFLQKVHLDIGLPILLAQPFLNVFAQFLGVLLSTYLLFQDHIQYFRELFGG